MMYSVELVNIPVAIVSLQGFMFAVWFIISDSHVTCLCTEIFPAWGIEYVGKWFWLKVGTI
jgi:hypothetical protein